MSDFADMMVEMLPLHSQLQKKDNPLRIVLDRTVGAYMDDFEIPYEQIFVTTATGGWLDAWGKDYGVPRRLDEDDEHYRQRIIYEKLDHLTPALLNDVYNVKLFTYRLDFDVTNNTLVSDNPYIVEDNTFIGLSDIDTIAILDKKFVLNSIITWVNRKGSIDYIIDVNNINILSDYSKMYQSENLVAQFRENESIFLVRLILDDAIDCRMMFEKCSELSEIDLSLPNATNCASMFEDCSDLENTILDLPNAINCGRMFDSCSSLQEIDLNLPNATDCSNMFFSCVTLRKVKLNLPKLKYYNLMFYNCSNLETIDVNIPTDKVSSFKSYITGLNLQHLTSFIINGEEQL